MDSARQIAIVEGLKHYASNGDFSKMPLPDVINPRKKFSLSPKDVAVRDAIVDKINAGGIYTSLNDKEGQRVLRLARRNVLANKKTVPDTGQTSADIGQASAEDSFISETDIAKVCNNLDITKEKIEKPNLNTFISDIAKAIGAKRGNSLSQYVTIRAKNEDVVTLRLSNHNATVSNFDSHNITINSITHALKNHGENGLENSENSIPLREKDMELAPYIMTSPDYVRKGNPDALGRESIRFYKTLGNGYVVVVEKEQKNSPDDMDTITMWAERSTNVTDARSKRTSPMYHAQSVIISDGDTAKIRKDAKKTIAEDNSVYKEKSTERDLLEDIKFFRGSHGEALGFTVGGNIYLDPKESTPETAIHEYTHLWAEALRKVNAKAWSDIVALMNGEKELTDKVSKLYPELKGDELVEEVLANYSGKQFAEKTAGILDGENIRIPSNVVTPSLRSELEKLGVEITDEMKNGTYMKAPNGNKTNLNERQWVQVRTDNFKKWFGDWEKSARIDKLRNSKPVKITGNEITPSDDLKQYKKNALEFGKTLQGEYTNKDTGETIKLQRGRKNGGIKEILQHNYKDEEHLQSVAAIPQIIERSIYIDSSPNSDLDKNPGVSEYQHFVCGLNIGVIDYTVLSIIVVDSKGDRYYDHNLSRIEKGKLLDLINRGEAVQSDGFGSTPDTKSTTNSFYKYRQLISILKNNSSKVVDENGEPMVVYHGASDEMKGNDSNSLLRRLQNEAERINPIQLTAEIWSREIENKIFKTPIGDVRFGNNQYKKNIKKGREKEFGMLIPTIERPDLIFEEKVPEEGAERQTKYVFVKCFTENNAKSINYASVTIRKDGIEVVNSSHYLREKQVLNKIEKEQMLWNRLEVDSTSSAQGSSNDQNNALSSSKDNKNSEKKNSDNNIEYSDSNVDTRFKENDNSTNSAKFEHEKETTQNDTDSRSIGRKLSDAINIFEIPSVADGDIRPSAGTSLLEAQQFLIDRGIEMDKEVSYAAIEKLFNESNKWPRIKSLFDKVSEKAKSLGVGMRFVEPEMLASKEGNQHLAGRYYSGKNINRIDISSDIVKSDYLPIVMLHELIHGVSTRAINLIESEYTDEEQSIISDAKKNGTYMKAPNGNKTNLNERQWAQVRTDNFKKWFGDWEKTENIINGYNALTAISRGEDSVENAMWRYDLIQFGGTPNITFFFGKTGNPLKDYKGGFGLAHIGAKHGKDAVAHILDVIANGDVELYVEGNKTVVLAKDGYEVLLALTKDGNKETWLFNGWKVKNEKADAISEVSTQSDATQTSPTFSREDLGAALYASNLEILLDSANNSSKVVDENGEPMVVYRGDVPGRYIFDNEQGTYLSTSKNVAEGRRDKGRMSDRSRNALPFRKNLYGLRNKKLLFFQINT